MFFPRLIVTCLSTAKPMMIHLDLMYLLLVWNAWREVREHNPLDHYEVGTITTQLSVFTLFFLTVMSLFLILLENAASSHRLSRNH